MKYGTDWRRERGDLIYQGEGLTPDWDTIRELADERSKLREQVIDEGSTSQFESL